MEDHLYRFAGEAEAISLLPDYRGVDEHGNTIWALSGDGFCLDPVGHLSDIAPTEDLDNPDITQLEGWHLNLRIFDSRETPAPGHLVTVAHQRRIWA